jgi:translation initiation factor 2 subunit 3
VTRKYEGQSEISIGTLGHVDHGKTTLVSYLTGEWTDRHSDEIKRGISIRLGYAATILMKCGSCPEPEAFTTSHLAKDGKCSKCGGELEVLREISFVDSPGHESLMATCLSGASLMDGAILVIAADEPCPMPQTSEHLHALEIVGVKNIIIVQN